MNIQIISPDNQAGLTKDRNIIKEVLENAGHKCFLTNKNEHHNHRRRFNINIFIEHFNEFCIERYVPQSKVNILIPNPEWFEVPWKKYLPYATAIFTKTKDAQKIFSKIHKNVIFTSFTSVDKRMNIKKEKVFFHSCGKSHSKGTDKIIKAWMARGELPMLHLCAKERVLPRQIRWSNITHYMGYMKEPDFTKLQNKCQFHLCPSVYAGFGHYIWEALSMGNIVIVVNSPPMNEFIGDFGIKLMYQEKDA